MRKIFNIQTHLWYCHGSLGQEVCWVQESCSHCLFAISLPSATSNVVSMCPCSHKKKRLIKLDLQFCHVLCVEARHHFFRERRVNLSNPGNNFYTNINFSAPLSLNIRNTIFWSLLWGVLEVAGILSILVAPTEPASYLTSLGLVIYTYAEKRGKFLLITLFSHNPCPPPICH